MSKKLCLIFILLLSLSAFASEKIGVGAMVGNPTGLSAKKWLGGNNAVDGGLGMNLGRKSHFTIHSDYLLHSPGVLYFNDVYELDLYYGIGARMRFADEMSLGARVPVGLVHQFKENPFDVFGEVAPVIDFLGRTGVDLNLAVGGRFYF
jgi:hypothetical protein